MVAAARHQHLTPGAQVVIGLGSKSIATELPRDPGAERPAVSDVPLNRVDDHLPGLELPGAFLDANCVFKEAGAMSWV